MTVRWACCALLPCQRCRYDCAITLYALGCECLVMSAGIDVSQVGAWAQNTGQFQELNEHLQEANHAPQCGAYGTSLYTGHFPIFVPPRVCQQPACRHACSPDLWTVQERDQSVQKRAYKLLAVVCEQRPAYLRAHIQVPCPSHTTPSATQGRIELHTAVEAGPASILVRPVRVHEDKGCLLLW